MAEEKKGKCPECGKKCTGRLRGARTISGAELETFVFTCERCGAVWANVELPKTTEKRF